MKHDNQIIRSAKQLTQKECANYADGACVPEDCPCHLINPAYKTIHDGAIDCDWFVQVVLPLQPELLTAYWHEMRRVRKGQQQSQEPRTAVPLSQAPEGRFKRNALEI